MAKKPNPPKAAKEQTACVDWSVSGPMRVRVLRTQNGGQIAVEFTGAGQPTTDDIAPEYSAAISEFEDCPELAALRQMRERLVAIDEAILQARAAEASAEGSLDYEGLLAARETESFHVGEREHFEQFLRRSYRAAQLKLDELLTGAADRILSDCRSLRESALAELGPAAGEALTKLLVAHLRQNAIGARRPAASDVIGDAPICRPAPVSIAVGEIEPSLA
jgi:hypothetical protein